MTPSPLARRELLRDYNAQVERRKKWKRLLWTAWRWTWPVLALGLLVAWWWLDRNALLAFHKAEIEFTKRVLIVPQRPAVKLDISCEERGRVCRARERLARVVAK